MSMDTGQAEARLLSKGDDVLAKAMDVLHLLRATLIRGVDKVPIPGQPTSGEPSNPLTQAIGTLSVIEGPLDEISSLFRSEVVSKL